MYVDIPYMDPMGLEWDWDHQSFVWILRDSDFFVKILAACENKT